MTEFTCLRACCKNKSKDYFKNKIGMKEKKRRHRGVGERGGEEVSSEESMSLFYDLQQRDQKGWGPADSVILSVI